MSKEEKVPSIESVADQQFWKNMFDLDMGSEERVSFFTQRAKDKARKEPDYNLALLAHYYSGQRDTKQAKAYIDKISDEVQKIEVYMMLFECVVDPDLAD